jgi:hypothetical protein
MKMNFALRSWREESGMDVCSLRAQGDDNPPPVPDLVLPLLALLPQSGTPYFILFGAGFAIGIVGHLSGSRGLVAVGVALVAFAAFFLLVAFNLTENTPPEIENAR